MVVDALGKGAEPLVPVQACRHFHAGKLAFHGVAGLGVEIAAHEHVYALNLAQFAVADQAAGMGELGAGALLAAHLEYAAVLAYSLDELLAFVDADGRGRL